MNMLITGGWVLVGSGDTREVVRNGSVYIEDDLIVDVGKHERLSKDYSFDVELGSEQSIIIPGLMNVHHHGKGISTLQRGVVDEPLETRLVSYYEHKSDVDPYDDALLAAANQIESGVSSILVFHYGVEPSSSREYKDDLEKAVKAWMDSGLRVAFAPFVEDQDEGGVGMIRKMVGGDKIPQRFRHSEAISANEKTQSYFEAVHMLAEKYQGYDDRIRILLGPTGPQWCTDELLQKVSKTARTLKTGIHTHLLETKYQQIYGFEIWGKSQMEHLKEIDFLGPQVSCAHSVWLTDKDIQIMAETGATAVNNVSSNLRLFSGVAPVLKMKQRGVNVAMGSDALGINDDDDFFQEMRLCSLIHREWGVKGRKLSSNQILDMATIAGSRAILLEGKVGEIGKGMKADIVVLRSDRILSPRGASELPMMDLLTSRAKAADVDTVIVNGKILMRDRILTGINRLQLLDRIKKKMPKPREMSKELQELKAWMRTFSMDFESRSSNRA